LFPGIHNHAIVLDSYRAHQRLPKIVVAMSSAKQKVHPAEDDRFDAKAYRAHNEKDPRVLGAGPCEDKHLKVQFGPSMDPSSEFVHGNQFARWVDCAKCGLRMGTYPFKGTVGKFGVDVDPSMVEEALSRIRGMKWWSECSKMLVDGMIKIIEDERQGSAAGTQNVMKKKHPALSKAGRSPLQHVCACCEPYFVKKESEAEQSIDPPKKKVKVNPTMIVCQLCSEDGHGAKDCPF
jgi:hypothetical protein